MLAPGLPQDLSAQSGTLVFRPPAQDGGGRIQSYEVWKM